MSYRRFNKREGVLTILLLLGSLILVLGIGGCDDDEETLFDDPSKTPSHKVSPANAQYAGQAACVDCHVKKAAEYAQQVHGMDFRHHPSGRDLVAGSCAPCHTTGYNETSGYNAGGGLNQNLEGIGCEECHGPGANHGDDVTNINLVPDARDTCWDCHVASYKDIREGRANPRTDQDLYNSVPGRISVHHPQAYGVAATYAYEWPGKVYTNHRHVEISNSCVTCHMYTGAESHAQDMLEPDLEACIQCHPFSGSVEQLVEPTQEEMKHLLIRLGGEDAEHPGEPDEGATGGALGAWATAKGINLTANADPDNPAVKAYKGARHNYTLVLADKSFGVHNYDYFRQLIEDSLDALKL
ncbi:MAG: hypothetical protein HYV63_08980 [Candidatus Schekmanbacteria bacterium]|nr:hypothetical protein [Candidatus Schekmanbacteria bacterium]